MHAQRFASSDRERCRRDLALAAQGMQEDVLAYHSQKRLTPNKPTAPALTRIEMAEWCLRVAVDRYLKSF